MAVVNDSKAQIQMCLDCKRPECINCVVTIKDRLRKQRARVSYTEADFYRLYNLGYDDFTIAKTLGVPRQNITTYRNRRKLKANKYCGRGEPDAI